MRPWKPARALAHGVWVLAAVLAAAGSAFAAPPPDWMNCPASLDFDLHRDPNAEANDVRSLAPKAGGATSAEFAEQAKFSRLAYAMYDAFEAGKDPQTAFDAPGMKLVGMIYGNPGRDNEHRVFTKAIHTFYGFVAEDAAGNRTISFRGTMKLVEMIRDAQALQRPYPSDGNAREASAHVHNGFLKLFETLTIDMGDGEKPFSPALPELTAGRNTVFIGHSLGSALATLAGVEAVRRAPEIGPRLRILTFASPRVGDEGFAKLAAGVGRIDRVCNLVDLVTSVPASTRMLSYVHVGTPFRISSFDWPRLNNQLKKRGDQILCWHGDTSYAYMLTPNKTADPPAQCTAE